MIELVEAIIYMGFTIIMVSLIIIAIKKSIEDDEETH
tara:strand:+ start:44327 stop:44437 length:111 start_codon:yes stop_codon:yes gene_type:complete